MGTRKKEGEGRGGKNNQVHFCLYILIKYIYLFTYEKVFFFSLQDNSLFWGFFSENSGVCGVRGFFLALYQTDMAY